MTKASIYIDGSNSFYAQRKQTWNVDFKKLYDYCKSYGEIADAKYYSGESNTDGQQRFFNVLSRIGYGIKSKPIQENYNIETGETKRKANCDVEICVDMITEKDNYDTAILVGGNGDFLPLVRCLKDNDKKVVVISNKSMTSLQLVKERDVTYIDMATIKDDICREETAISSAAPSADSGKSERRWSNRYTRAASSKDEAKELTQDFDIV